MVGLVFAESLSLTAPQWTALVLNMAGWLWCYRQARRPSSSATATASITTILTLGGLWAAFWNTPTSIDQQMLFEQARYLSRYAWPEFLDAFAHRPYVAYQPPFFTFWVSRWPVFWRHQCVLFPWGLLCVGLMWQLYGHRAALLCATPVFALMIHQPCSDTILFGGLLMVLRLRQCAPQPHHGTTRKTVLSRCRKAFDASIQRPTRYPLLAALVYGATWMVKPLTLLTAPFVLPQLGMAGIGSLVVWGGYLWWSQRWEFGRRQFDFLLHQLVLTSMKRPGRSRLRPPSRRSPLEQLWRRLRGTIRWRWERLGRRALVALPVYLFPTWLRAWTWQGLVLAGMILVGYGNSKYLFLDLLFIFPVTTVQDVAIANSLHS